VAATLSELVRVIVTPAAGAGPEIVTVPVTAVVALPCTDVGAMVTLCNSEGVIVKVAVFDTAP